MMDSTEDLIITEKEVESIFTVPPWFARHPWLFHNPGKKQRAGFTKNHGRGLSKVKRKIVKASRKRNRGT
jgi:hypothetical protein